MNKAIDHTYVNEQEESEPLSLETCLLSAIMHGDIKGIKYFLELGADIECIDEEGRTPLYWASYYGQTQAALLLMEYGANVNSMTHTCATPLFIAALMGRTETVLALCDKGATVEVRETDSSMTPLFAAALNGHTEVVLALCERGADIESSDCIGVSPLFIAAAQGHKETVLALATRGADIHAVDDNGWNIPCAVAQNGHAEVLTTLLDLSCDIDSPNSLGMTPLFVASMAGQAEIVRYLLERGANINAASNNGDTPLIVAIRNEHTEIARMLISQGADVNVTNASGWSAYKYNKNPEIAQELIDHGVDTEIAEAKFVEVGETPEEMRAVLELTSDGKIPLVSQNGVTPLMHAAKGGYADIVIKMINNECNINAVDSEGNTALCYAVTHKHEEIVRLLLENGANPDIKNKHGWTPLIRAAFDGFNEIVSILIKHGADLKAKEHKTNATALHLAAQNGHAETVEVLIANGAETEARQKNGATPLLMAVDQGQMTSVLTLLRNGANPEVVDPKGRTPLHIAANRGYPEIALALINHGAIVDCKEYQGATPLFLAAAYGMLDMVLTLLEVGADINATDDTLFTPLSIAILNGHSEIAMLLMDKGADIETENNEGEKPLHIAAQCGNVEVAEALINKGARLDESRPLLQDSMMNLLCAAAERGDSATLALLIEKMKVKGKLAQTVLETAFKHTNDECIKLLLAVPGVDVMPTLIISAAEAKETYPLLACLAHPSAEKKLPVAAIMAAVEKDRAKNLQLLLNHPEKVEGSCLDALILAAKRKGKMVDVLLRAFDWSMSEVVAAFEASIMNGRMNNAHLLLEWCRKQKETKEKLSHLNDKERTAFENALVKVAGCQDVEMLDLLLSDEYEWSSAAIVSALLASVKADTQRNMEKLLTWCGQKNIDVPQSVRDDMWISSLKKKKYNLLHLMLTNLGTNVNSVVDFPHGRGCALNYAVGEGNIKLVKTLLAVKGIDVNNRDNHLEISPLCLAVTNGYKDIASLLLSTPGIDLNSTDSTGKTALDLAYYYNDTELIDMLKKLGAEQSAPHSSVINQSPDIPTKPAISDSPSAWKTFVRKALYLFLPRK